MDASTAGWVLLIAVALFFVVPFLLPRNLTSTQVCDRSKRLDLILRHQLYQFVAGFALIMQVVSAWQGVHLLQSGYDVNLFEADSSVAARTAARGRGKGGIIILIIQFFPLFLLGGYGWLAKETYGFLAIARKRLRVLEKISLLSPKRMAAFEILLARDCDDKKEPPESYIFAAYNNVIENYPDDSQPKPFQSQPRPQSQPQPRPQAQAVDAPKKPSSGSQENPPKKDKLESSLARLNDLRTRGVITEQEYGQMRRKELGLD